MVLVLLPPSETKAAGGNGAPLALERLGFDELNPTRAKIADALVELAADVPASRAALGLSQRQDTEIERNAALWTSPTLPALHRYTGVLYDALDPGTFDTEQMQRARQRLAVASALFGLVRADDPIPAYRLSAGSRLPSLGPLRELWREALEPTLAREHGLVVDLRSGAYTALARVSGAVTLRVVTEDSSGHRKTVSHHNKSYKGRVAATLAAARQEPTTVSELRDQLAEAGFAVEHTTPTQLELLTG